MSCEAKSKKCCKTPYILLVLVVAIASFAIGRLSVESTGVWDSVDTTASLLKAELDSTVLPIIGSPAKGSSMATVTLVVFTDYESPTSRTLWNVVLEDAFEKYGAEQLRVVNKAFPLKDHEYGVKAAVAAAAAQNQGKFWEMHQWLNAQDRYDEVLTLAKVKDLGMDVERFKADLKNLDTMRQLKKDADLGKKLGVTSVPAVFINGSLFDASQGLDSSKLDTAIASEIRRVKSIPWRAANANYVMAGITNHSFIDSDIRDASLCNAPKTLNRPILGSENAKVTILEFSDYECPFCSRGNNTINELLKIYGDDIRVAFVHRPLSFHKNAQLAHQAAYAAGKQGKFWEMHELLFSNQKKLQRENLFKYAAQIGLDPKQFERDLTAPETVKAIEDDIKYAETFGVSGTPAFSVNGTMIRGAQPVETFKTTIDLELKKANELAQRTGLCGDKLFDEIMKNVKPAERPAPEGRLFVELAGAQVFGNPQAPITIVEFTDFQCPFCARGSNTVKELVAKYPNDVKLVFRHYPLPMHKDAPLAHRAAEAAQLQGKFWDYYQLLFDNQKAVKRDDLIGYAQKLGLDVARFTKDLDDPSLDAIVKRDIDLGNRVKVKGTPHFFINGKRFSGAQPIEKFEAEVKAELKVILPYRAQNMPADQIYKTVIEKHGKPAGAQGGDDHAARRPTRNIERPPMPVRQRGAERAPDVQ